MQDDRTSNFNLPKPSTANILTDDVVRLRSALDLIDTAIAARATIADINTQLATLVGSAPTTLDTLAELAAAISNNPNFATTIATQIASLQASLSSLAASGVSYSGASSGISATTVQGAIDYLKNIAGAGSGGSVASYTRQKFTATAGQTTFTTSGYTVGYLQVFLNGVLLDFTDYTAANGSTVVLATGAAVGDELVTIALDSFNIANLLRVLTASASAPAGSVSVGADGGLTVKSLNGGQLAGMRNRIINGDMRVDQRNAGALHTLTSGATYYLDRWYALSVGASATAQRVAGSGSQNQYRFNGVAGVTAIYFGQKIESSNVYDLAGGTVTLSLDISNNLLTTVSWNAYYANSADNFSGLTYIGGGDITVNATSSRYSVQIALPAGAANGVRIEFGVGAQTSGKWTIGNIQLEKGSVATPFEFRPYGAELALCQRYYQITTNVPSIGATGTTILAGNAIFKGSMRATPSVGAQGVLNCSDGAADYLQSSANATFINGNTESALITMANFAGLAQYRPYHMSRQSSNSNGVTLSAEL